MRVFPGSWGCSWGARPGFALVWGRDEGSLEGVVARLCCGRRSVDPVGNTAAVSLGPVSTPLRPEGLGGGGLALQLSWASRPCRGVGNKNRPLLHTEKPCFLSTLRMGKQTCDVSRQTNVVLFLECVHVSIIVPERYGHVIA